eukprot:7160914-Alexandrium_andersonii.AAC.1
MAETLQVLTVAQLLNFVRPQRIQSAALLPGREPPTNDPQHLSAKRGPLAALKPNPSPTALAG